MVTTETRETLGKAFYQEQLEYIFAKDVDGLVDNHYHEDAVLVRFDQTIRGRDALKAFFRDYIASLGELTLKSTDNFTETEDTLFFEATVESDLGTVGVYDAFVLVDGKARYHFTGLK